MYSSLIFLTLFGFLAGLAGIWAFSEQKGSRSKPLATLSALLALASLCLGGFALLVMNNGM